MKTWFTIALVVLPALWLQAQQRLVEGWLSDSDGQPLIGVSIVVKGTTTGTTTDIDGHYTIRAPIGATLVFSFVGLKTREMVVTADNASPTDTPSSFKTDLKPVPPALFTDTVSGRGVAVLDEFTPRYKRFRLSSPASIRSIRKIGSRYHIRTTEDLMRSPVELQFTTALGIERVTQLPALQSTYAQGRPVNGGPAWRGADQREIFSWGPRTDALEFDGSSYPYDSRGKLVGAGSGNGQAAATYNVRPFFKTAVTLANEIMVQLGRRKSESRTIIDLEQRSRWGIIPGTRYDKINVRVRLNDYSFFKQSYHRVFSTLSTHMSAGYNRSTADLPAHGGNLAALVGGLFTTPGTFNNAEGYRLPDGAVRSYAPGLADNPLGVTHEFPGRDVLDNATGSVKFTSSPWHFATITLGGDAEVQRSKNFFGTPPGYSGYARGRFTLRQEDQGAWHIAMLSEFKPKVRYSDILIIMPSYQAYYTSRRLRRTDASGFTIGTYDNINRGEALIMRDRMSNRTMHEVALNITYERDRWLRIKGGNLAYFSNTLVSGTYTNFFPSAGVRLDFARLLDSYLITSMQVYSVFTRLPREAPLIYGNWSYATLHTGSERYTSAYEGSELYSRRGLNPEIVSKTEAGLKLDTYNVSGEVCFYNNKTDNFIAPVYAGSVYKLTNAASILNRGVTITAAYNNRFGLYNWGVDVNWSKYTSQADNIYSAAAYIPLAGFSDVQTVLAPGKPVGAIYGSAYVRNAEGKRVIGSDGFPIHDTSLRMIGNPVPDWTLGWTGYIKREPFSLSFVFDFKKGGDIWNGTRAALDYLGRSAGTAAQRGVTGYVFDGVTAEGTRNATAVNFADATQPVENNRWVRYGWSGVGEDYIEDTSWIRMSELNFSYTIDGGDRLLRQVKFTLTAHNLFLITPYSGVDPASALFGYSTGRGLDLFNMPAVRSYNAQLTLKI